MPTALANLVGGDPQVLTSDITFDVPGSNVQASPLAQNPTAEPFVRGTRNLALPDPTVGGWAEASEPMSALQVDTAISPNVRGPLIGQGSIDSIPTAGEQLQIDGPGTPNKHGAYLTQGVLTQLLSYQPDQTAGALGYIASLTGRQTNGLGGLA